MSSGATAVGRVDRKTHYGRFSALLRTDGRWVVFDPALAFAHNTTAVCDGKDEACDVAERLSFRADWRGEANERERKGFIHDWGDPGTWEKFR